MHAGLQVTVCSGYGNVVARCVYDRAVERGYKNLGF